MQEQITAMQAVIAQMQANAVSQAAPRGVRHVGAGGLQGGHGGSSSWRVEAREIQTETETDRDRQAQTDRDRQAQTDRDT
eukprot:146576-Rhodomonas_salina.3